MEDVDRIRQLYQETGSRRKVANIMGISRNVNGNVIFPNSGKIKFPILYI